MIKNRKQFQAEIDKVWTKEEQRLIKREITKYPQEYNPKVRKRVAGYMGLLSLYETVLFDINHNMNNNIQPPSNDELGVFLNEYLFSLSKRNTSN